ncbi:MAG: transporter [Planctomycetota bacterium]
MLRNTYVVCLALLLCIILCLPTLAEETTETTKKIQDNSFMIEEAYNQEAGVIQHIQTFQYLEKSHNWAYSFVQEWPVLGQTHQFSYSIPISHLDDPTNQTGMNDIALNYRYQVPLDAPIALAPRFSTLIPTGDEKNGFGTGAVGYQINIPLSIELSNKFINHWNVGTTITPHCNGDEGADADTFGLNLGTSLIWLATERFNLMLETMWNSTESVLFDGIKERADAVFINPGVRYAFDFTSGLQIVPGISFPIGFGSATGEFGVLVYLSFEHPLF